MFPKELFFTVFCELQKELSTTIDTTLLWQPEQGSPKEALALTREEIYTLLNCISSSGS